MRCMGSWAKRFWVEALQVTMGNKRGELDDALRLRGKVAIANILSADNAPYDLKYWYSCFK
jgi:hypothetical protein